MKIDKHLKKTFVRQQEWSDCGIACLLSIMQFYGGEASFEGLREQSGTGKSGTTLAGLYQTAQLNGFDAKGLKKQNTKDLIQEHFPSILHLNIDGKRLHYVVCYAFEQGKFLIGDPAQGLSWLSQESLEEMWESKVVLVLSPNEDFQKKSQINKAKKQWLIEFIENDYITLLVSGFIGVLSTALGLTLALFTQKLIDDILPQKDIELFIISIVLVAILLLSRIGLDFLRSFILIKQNRIFNNRMLRRFFEKLLYLPINFFESRRTGELIARMNDANKIQQTISALIGSLVIDLLIVLVFSIAVFTYHTHLGLLAIAFMPIIVIWTFKTSKKIASEQKKAMVAYSDNESNYVQKLKGIHTIKVFQKEKEGIEETSSIYEQFQDALFTLQVTSIKFKLPLQILGVLYALSILSYSTYLIFEGILTIGELTAIISITAGIFPAIVRIVSANVQLQGGKVAFDRMYEITARPPEFSPQEDQTSLPPIEKLEVKELSFRFPGQVSLLEKASLTAHSNEITAILGSSGSGKTTFFNLLQKLYSFEGGDILMNESMRWNEITHSSWRQSMVAIPQSVALLNAPLIDNICLKKPNQEEVKKVLAFCQQLGFAPYFSKFPQGIATKIEEEGVNISGGQKQLLALARALYANPQVLLLDEPTASMDKEMAAFTVSLLQRMKKGKMVFIITHQEQIAEQMDKVYKLENKQLRELSLKN